MQKRAPSSPKSAVILLLARSGKTEVEWRFLPANTIRVFFINCPFDRQYLNLFHGIIFAVHDCGFIARCAREINDTSQIRVSKIFQIISECRIGIHDISRTQLDQKSRLPRFNMPLELGMFLGAKEYGPRKQREKLCLVLDREPFRYQKFCSDIAGQDIGAHGGKVERAISEVRDFLRSARRGIMIPGGAKIARRYAAFQKELPLLCRRLGMKKSELIFNDFTTLVSEWLKVHAQP